MRFHPQYHELHRYSEWLDNQGLITDYNEADKRTLDDLVQEFLAHTEEQGLGG